MYMIFQERQDPSETYEGLTHTKFNVAKNPNISDQDLEKTKHLSRINNPIFI